MIPQAGIFSAIPFTQINSKTMIVALLARLAEKSGPCPGCRLLLWGALKTRGKNRGYWVQYWERLTKWYRFLTCISTFHFTKQPPMLIDFYLLAFYRWENWHSVMLSSLPKAFHNLGWHKGYNVGLLILKYLSWDEKVTFYPGVTCWLPVVCKGLR